MKCRRKMQQSKPEVVDRVDFESQLEALVEAAEDAEIHQSEISTVLSTHAKTSQAKEWE